MKARAPNDAESMHVYAVIAVKVAQAKMDGGDWAGACAMMDDALAAAPALPGLRANAAAVWTNAGVAWLRAGDDAKAESAWKHAIEVDPASSSAAKTNLDRLPKR